MRLAPVMIGSSASHPAEPIGRSLEYPTPNLFLVGAPKCGTTSMYEYLRGHPQIYFPSSDDDYWRAKEPNHFCPEMGILEKYSIKDEGKYLRLYRAGGDAVWRGDASPYYLSSESAPERIKQLCPNARILIMLRPPVEMMRSYHRDLLRIKLEDIADFLTAINARADGNGRLYIRPRRWTPGYRDYAAISHFARQVERYQHLFGKDAVKVVLLEDMVADPAATFREVLSFLDVDVSFRPEFRVHNETPRNGTFERLVRSVYGTRATKAALAAFVSWRVRRRLLSAIRRLDRAGRQPDPSDRRLQQLYAPEVERLARLIGRNLDHWQP